MFGRKDFLKKYGTMIKYVLLFIVFFVMLWAIKTFVNYTTIIENIEVMKWKTQQVQNEVDYINNFQTKYLESNHAMFFLSHENNIIDRKETLIVFKTKEEEAEITNEATNKKTKTPPQERNHFLYQKYLKSIE